MDDEAEYLWDKKEIGRSIETINRWGNDSLMMELYVGLFMNKVRAYEQYMNDPKKHQFFVEIYNRLQPETARKVFVSEYKRYLRQAIIKKVLEYTIPPQP